MLYTIEYEDGTFYVSAWDGTEAFGDTATEVRDAILTEKPDARFQFNEHAFYAAELGGEET